MRGAPLPCRREAAGEAAARIAVLKRQCDDAIMEPVVRTCRRGLLDRTLIRKQRHLLHALREYERFYTCTGRMRESRGPGR